MRSIVVDLDMKVWEDQDASFAWFVGFFEGDGSFNLVKGRLYLCLDGTDRDSIERCHELFGGCFYGPLPDKNRKAWPGSQNVKPMYQWRLHRQAEVWPLVDKMYPYLSARRRTRIDEARERRLARIGQVV